MSNTKDTYAPGDIVIYKNGIGVGFLIQLEGSCCVDFDSRHSAREGLMLREDDGVADAIKIDTGYWGLQDPLFIGNIWEHTKVLEEMIALLYAIHNEEGGTFEE